CSSSRPIPPLPPTLGAEGADQPFWAKVIANQEVISGVSLPSATARRCDDRGSSPRSSGSWGRAGGQPRDAILRMPKIAPWGSVTQANRPPAKSIGGTITLPPADSTVLAAASTSGTSK